MTDHDVKTKPWGCEEVLTHGNIDGNEFKVKLITIYDGQRFSLQHHRLREEIWVFLSGTAIVTTEDRNYANSLDHTFFTPGQFCHIPKHILHRVEAYRGPVTFLEVQRGGCDDTDIVRWEDDYGRADEE